MVGGKSGAAEPIRNRGGFHLPAGCERLLVAGFVLAPRFLLCVIDG